MDTEVDLLRATLDSNFFAKNQIASVVWGTGEMELSSKLIYIEWLARDNTSNLSEDIRIALIHRLSKEN